MADDDAVAAAHAPLPDEPTPTTDTGAPQEPAQADDQGGAAAPGDAPAVQEQDGDDAAAEPSEDGQKPKPKGGFQRRIGELTRQARDAERDRDRLLGLVEKLTGGGAQPQPVAAHEEQPPREEDFKGDVFAFTTAQAVYAAKQAVRADIENQRKRDAEASAGREAAERKAAFDRQVEAARERFEDFDAVVYRMPKDGGPPINDAMAEVIQTSERGAELAYYLGTNVAEAQRLYGLSPVAAARELGLIEAKLSLPKPRTVTKAPDPIRPVGSGGASPATDPNKLSYTEYVKARREGRI